MKNTPRSEIIKILEQGQPSRFVYSPNYWQWFKHQKDHNLLPEEIKHCNSLLDLYRYLGVDIFSRNFYSDPENYWFGGICDEVIDNFKVSENKFFSGNDKVTVRQYSNTKCMLKEELLYVFKESTLVQKKFLVSDYIKEYPAFRRFVAGRRWVFQKEKFNRYSQLAGENGLVIAGEFFSPLKMLHLTMGPVNSVYFLMECPAESKEILALHEKAQLDCIKQCVANGVKVVMAMDNLDTLFHPPDYVREYSSSFYKEASTICHKNGAAFFIHACGHQKDNLALIASYGVDGLEGIAFPPLGDVTLVEAMNATPENFILTGGISAMETRDLDTREKIFNYVEDLFTKLVPYKNRFIFSSSCNTPIDCRWETIINFRDAWLKFR